uniref:uncharacterized protein LOC129513083 n=1 Tax=Nyctereutes procyonoides TaxID=34880 RepID=UPI0024446BD4|nr:uncharacterized protein LOC129513083 [Nyctereutes procyonoides]
MCTRVHTCARVCSQCVYGHAHARATRVQGAGKIQSGACSGHSKFRVRGGAQLGRKSFEGEAEAACAEDGTRAGEDLVTREDGTWEEGAARGAGSSGPGPALAPLVCPRGPGQSCTHGPGTRTGTSSTCQPPVLTDTRGPGRRTRRTGRTKTRRGHGLVQSSGELSPGDAAAPIHCSPAAEVQKWVPGVRSLHPCARWCRNHQASHPGNAATREEQQQAHDDPRLRRSQEGDAEK